MFRKALGIGLILLMAGCGSARMSTTVFDKEGNVVSKSEIKYTVIGSRKLESVDVDISAGKAKIGKQSASSGALTKLVEDTAKVFAGATGGLVVPK